MEDTQNEEGICVWEVDDEVRIDEVEEKRFLGQITLAVAEAGKVGQFLKGTKESVGRIICSIFAKILESILDDREDIVRCVCGEFEPHHPARRLRCSAIWRATISRTCSPGIV